MKTLKRRHADFSVKSVLGKINIIDKIFYMLYSSWESAKKTTAYAEAYAKKNGMSYARPVSGIVKGDSVFKRIGRLIKKLSVALKNYSFTLCGTILKQILDLVLLIPKLIAKILFNKETTQDEQISLLLDKKAGKIANVVGKLAKTLKAVILNILNLLMKQTVSKGSFDPNDGMTIEVDSKYGKVKSRKDKRFRDDLIAETKDFFKNISLILMAFKNGDPAQGYLMLKGLSKMISLSIFKYKKILTNRLLNVVSNGGIKNAIKTTANEIIDIKKLASMLKNLISFVGTKGKEVVKDIVYKLFSLIKSGIAFITKAKKQSKIYALTAES